MGEAKFIPIAEVETQAPGTLREAFEHERRRASMLEGVVVDQLAAIGLLLEEHTRQIAALEAKLEGKPKSTIIQLR